MIEPILAHLQHALLRSALEGLNHILGSGVYTGDGRLGGDETEFDELILLAARRHGLDPNLVKAVVKAESNFSPLAISHAGAKGLMQLMDATARELGVADSFDPLRNIEGGTRYLSQMLSRYNGDVLLALAAYNAGPAAVDRWGGVPPIQETQGYVERVLGLAEQYHSWSA